MLPRVWEYCQKHKSAGRTWSWFYPYKLLELWEILQKEKPLHILELGSGCTTAVFAEYANMVGTACDFRSIDESEEWQDSVIEDLAPYERLRADWFRVSESQWIGSSAVHYQNVVYPTSYDFIYIDGPSNNKDNHEAICLDAQPALAGPNLKTAVFDIRRRTVEYCQHFNPPFDWQLSCWQESGVPWYLSGIRHHTVARRRA